MRTLDLKHHNEKRIEAMLRMLELVKADVNDNLLKGVFIVGLDKEGSPYFYQEYLDEHEVEMIGAITCTMNNILRARGTVKNERHD